MYKRLKKIKKLLPLYIMALPALVYLFINNYLPLTGMVVAFKDFDYSKGIYGSVDDFDEIRDWAAFHHERLDGTGYPFGKTAAELNTQERMMACIDIYQALTESRPYKQGMPHEKACEILRDMANKGWLDDTIVKQVEDCFRG